MKKKFFVGGTILLIATVGLKPVEAETGFYQGTKQVVNNTAKTSPATQPQVELLNAGSGAKYAFRLQPVVNTKQTVVMTMNMDMAMSIAGKSTPAFKLPGTVMTIQATVTKIDPNGDIHYEFSYSDVDVVGEATLPPQVLNEMRSQIKKLASIKGTGIVDRHGITKKINFVLPTGLDVNLKQSLQQMSDSLQQLSSPIPQVAVGIGAKWRVTSDLNVSSMNLKQIATYELVEFKDGVPTLNVSVEQQASPFQKLTTPGLPPEVTLTLKSYNGTGQGQVTLSLNQLIPSYSTLSMHTNTEMIFKNPSSNEQTTMNQELSMKMTMESK